MSHVGEFAARPSYADYYRTAYPFEQEHRSAGGLNLLRAPCHPAGDYAECGRGVSLLISRRSRPGTSRIDLGAGRFTADLSAPNYLVAPPDQVCTYELSADIDLLAVEFPVETFRNHPWRLQDLGPLHFGARTDPLPIQLAERLWELSAQGLTRLEADSLSMAIVTLLVRAPRSAPTLRAPRGGLGVRDLQRLADHWRDRIADDLSLADLAALVGLSPYHFARAFKASMGIPPHRYQMTLRVERAKDLLATTGLSITEIAHACGFASSQHMATVFRRIVGATPSDYRKGNPS